MFTGFENTQFMLPKTPKPLPFEILKKILTSENRVTIRELIHPYVNYSILWWFSEKLAAHPTN